MIQFVFVCILDSYFWKVGKKTVGVYETRMALFFYLTNKSFNEIITGCFSNGIETIFTVVAFHYFLKIKDSMNSNVAIFAILVTLSSMIRNTSALGWLPLLFVKIYYNNSLKPLIIAFLTYGLATFALCILIDSVYYSGN